MTASMMILGNLTHVDRPAIASLVPTSEGFSLLIDAGANIDVKPINLVQFAVMGSVYWRHVRNVSRPRVGILSNGEEASKGNEQHARGGGDARADADLRATTSATSRAATSTARRPTWS